MWTLLSLLAIAAVVYLGWNYYRQSGSKRIAGFNEKRRAASRIVGRGEFVDGNRHLDVALALTQSTFFYENGDMEASIDLQWVREIEYDNELATGTVVANGKVLRLRTHSQTFEFVLPTDVVPRWHMMLPPRRLNSTAAGNTQIVLAPAVVPVV